MLTLAVLCALILGWCTGGRLARWEEAGLHLLPLPVAALVLQAAVHAPWAILLSYALIFVFLLRNRHLKKTAALLGAGSLCNLAVIAANGWRMPVVAQALELLSPQTSADLLAGMIPMYTAAVPDTKLLFLGDVLYCPLPLLGGFASIGDLLLMAGIFFCILAVMSPTKLPRWMKSG